MTILLAVLAGGALGYVLERGDFCFHNTWRALFSTPGEPSLADAYLVLLLVATPIVQILVATEVIDPFVAPLAWRATLVGGLIFGVGMAVARSCVSGLFYKLGHGMVGTIVGLVAWAVGDIVAIRGPLRGLRSWLNENPVSSTDDNGQPIAATVTSVLGPVGVILLVVLGAMTSWYLWRAHRHQSSLAARGAHWGWLRLGVATALVICGAWLLARAHDVDYPYGTSGVPAQIWGRLVRGEDSELWIPLALVSLVPGAFVAARRSGTLWWRGETWVRCGQLAAGGLAMGIGAGIAGGCNLGHSMVGVPLLSLGSISATFAMIAGVAMVHFLPKRRTYDTSQAVRVDSLP